MLKANSLDIACKVFRKYKDVHGSYDLYPGILAMQAMARLATETGQQELITEIREVILPYVRGEREFFANFPNYLCGGNGAAWLYYQGKLPEAENSLIRYANQILNEAPKDSEGILTHPGHPGKCAIWIDVAFAVTPFLLFTGLALENDDYIEEGFQQTAKMLRVFHCEETGLFFQCRSFRGPGELSQDHWSRGNGWGALALCELAVHLPENHPHKAEAVRLYKDHISACARFQDESGLWHQEMTENQDSYVETSGSALLLYALALGIQAGLIPDSERSRLHKGLKALLIYISQDYDIFHTCIGCLCPGDGTKRDYMAKPPKVNDRHAFGPITLAMGQAHLLGIKNL